MQTLQYLLSPCSNDQFLANYWTQKALHVEGQPHRFNVLFSWYALNHLLNYHQFTESDLRFSIHGQSLPHCSDPHVLRERLHQGATLIINGLHNRVPGIAELVTDLRQELGYRAHVNLYCSPARQQGFACHYDTHEVFILQVEGEKEWFVYPETVTNPTPGMPSTAEEPPAGSPYLTCLLKPGDVLYIPRGHWHYAIAGDAPSLHLTVGVDCLTGLDWLDWLRCDLQAEPEWRESLPAIANGNSQPLKQHLQALQERLTTLLQDDDRLQRALHDFIRQDAPNLPISLPAQMGADVFPDGFTTQFTWTLPQPLHVKQVDEAHYQVNLGSKQLDLKGLPHTFAEKIFSANQFKLSDVAVWAPEMDLEEDITPLLTCLVQEGALLVESL